MGPEPRSRLPVLLDGCVGRTVAQRLRDAGHDVLRVSDLGSDPGDAEVPRLAADQGRVLIAEDKDFGQIIIAQGRCHRGIIRLVQLPFSAHAETCLPLLDTPASQLAAGAIVTAEPGRVRIRRPEAH